MPFTVSHAAAVLPLRKLNLITSAFIVGSMAPDFPYIIGNTEYRGLGHQFPGVIEFTIPASLLALWLFHSIIKRPILGLLPASMQERLRGQTADFNFGGASRFLAILASISLGILSHLAWDSFTHAYTWPWRRFAWLRGFVHIPFVHHRLQLFAALQYISTVAGILALAIWVVLWYRRSAPRKSIAEVASQVSLRTGRRDVCHRGHCGNCPRSADHRPAGERRESRPFSAGLRRDVPGYSVLAASVLLCAGIFLPGLDHPINRRCPA